MQFCKKIRAQDQGALSKLEIIHDMLQAIRYRNLFSVRGFKHPSRMISMFVRLYTYYPSYVPCNVLFLIYRAWFFRTFLSETSAFRSRSHRARYFSVKSRRILILHWLWICLFYPVGIISFWYNRFLVSWRPKLNRVSWSRSKALEFMGLSEK